MTIVASHKYAARWVPGASVEHVDLPNGSRIRYLKVGTGRPMVLLHTLRTQSDYFYKLIPLLRNRYTLYVPDMPGLGYSKMPKGRRPDEPFFRDSMSEFVAALGLSDVTLVGESAGATVALTMAAVAPTGISAVYAINPYDYGERFGGGIRRSKFGAIIGLFAIFGPYTAEAKPALNLVLRGGVSKSTSLTTEFVTEMHKAGLQRGYRRLEYLMFKHWRTWVAATKLYRNIKIPTTVIYSEHDWSLPAEREHHKELLPKATFHAIADAGHFVSLEAPEAVARLIG
jgi:pimeloyl-ACP methyl ester carboxylesterase